MLAHVITQEEELDFPLSTLLIKKFDIFGHRVSKIDFDFCHRSFCFSKKDSDLECSCWHIVCMWCLIVLSGRDLDHTV